MDGNSILTTAPSPPRDQIRRVSDEFSGRLSPHGLQAIAAGLNAQIAVLNIRRVGQFVRAAGPHHAAALDDVVAVGDAGERVDVLVDDQDRLARRAQSS